MLMPAKHVESSRSEYGFTICFSPSSKKDSRNRSYTCKIYCWCRFFSACPGIPPDQDKLNITEQLDFSRPLFVNPVTFLAFLAEFIRQTMLTKDNESIDVGQIITKAAGGRMGLPGDVDQLQHLSS